MNPRTAPASRWGARVRGPDLGRILGVGVFRAAQGAVRLQEKGCNGRRPGRRHHGSPLHCRVSPAPQHRVTQAHHPDKNRGSRAQDGLRLRGLHRELHHQVHRNDGDRGRLRL